MLDCQIKDRTSNINQNNQLVSPEMKEEKRAGGESKTKGCIGLSERMEIERMRKYDSGEPDSWLSRNFMIFVVLGLFAYTYYVFVVRVTTPMIRIDESRLGSYSQGIAYIVVYHLLFIMFLWSYTMLISHGPGFAVDYIEKTDPPIEDVQLVEYVGQNFEHYPKAPRPSSNSNDLNDPSSFLNVEVDSTQGPEVVDEETRNQQHPIAGAFRPTIASAVDRITDSEAQSPSTSTNLPTYPPATYSATANSRPNSYLHFPEPSSDYEPEGFRPIIERQPVQIPVLTDNYLYDSRVGILRPYRSHRCRHCATVVLRMDHHCPWERGCVGAKNHKYFINFVQWSSIFTLFVMISLIFAITSSFEPPRSRPPMDGQIVAIIIISGFFTLFTSALYAAHVRLALLNTTTIEEIGIARMRARERAALSQVYGFSDWRGKRATKNAWNLEWGRISKEGNLWWLGSRRANWEMLMGKNVLGWFLPIPAKNKNDGLTYIPNPRHSKEGYWRRRKEWDESLR